ncbi:hypothetical protein THRCLA_20484 [Thraustotheca clavata]|uniref:Secreted protein n=1 Tax=Thraustotheca clavata TaxID=74557 RepID=A0A1W0A6W8_9STRA|nr:hypothetical protein THRCLA_20484 [Thraustotheca clavata]
MRTVLLAACVLVVHADVGLGPPVLPQVLSTLLDVYKPLLANYTSSQLPATIGNCAKENPPTPCLDTGNLYEDTGSDWYKVTARWISGINTMSITSLGMTADENGQLALNMQANFKHLPMSLFVEGCLFNQCATVLDNTKYCCGDDKNVMLTATAVCNESYPFLRNVTFSQATITPALNVQVVVAGKAIKLKDVTTAVQDGIKQTAGNFLQTKGMELLNTQIKELFGPKVYCSQASKDRQTPTPTTIAPTTILPNTSAPTTTALDNIVTATIPITAQPASSASFVYISPLLLLLCLLF